MIDLLIARAALRDAVRPKRLVTALLLILLPSALGLFWHSVTLPGDWDPERTYDTLFVALVFGFTLTILAVVYGTGIVAQEVEQRTIVYLLTRPLPRWRILFAKFVVSYAIVAAISVLTTILLALVVFGPAHFTEAGVVPDIRSLLLGAFAYTSVFLLLGALVPRPLIYGLLFVFGWEGIASNLPGSLARISIMSYLRVLASREVTNAAPSDDSGGGLLAKLSKPPDIDISSKEALIILVVISLVSLVLAAIVFSKREYVPREDAE